MSDLEKLKKKLYKNSEDSKERIERNKFHSSAGEVKTEWAEKNPYKEEKNTKEMTASFKKKKRGFKFWLVVFFIVLILGLGGLAYYFSEEFLWGGNIVSSKKIDMVVKGLSLVDSGKLNKWQVSITNNNDVTMEIADLVINYPEVSLSLENEELSKERMPLGKILPGQTVSREVEFFILAQKDEERKLDFSLEYRMENSNAIFAKTVEQPIKIANPPVAISFKLPREIESGQKISFDVEYVSNSDTVIKDLYVKMEYPAGFQFLDSNIKPARGKDTWFIGDFAPQEKRTLEILGLIEGQDLMEVSFRANTGFDEDNGQFVSFADGTESVLLKKPFLGLSFLINGQDIDVIQSDRRNVNVTIPWKNNLATEVQDAVVEVGLTGDVVDLSSLSVRNGSYRASDNKIVWNSSSLPDLKKIVPGQQSNLSFSFSLKTVFPVNSADDKDFTFNLAGEMFGKQILENNEVTEIRSSFSKEVKVGTNVQLSSKLNYSSGQNPPKAGEETFYSVVWSISNFYNDVSSVVVRASLPSYVTWVSSSENILYSASTGELVWNVGEVSAGTGIIKPVKEATFQIKYMPGLNQVGESPTLVTASSLEARDNFTDLIIRDTEEPLKIENNVIN